MSEKELIPEVNEFVLYILAEDQGTTEITDDGTSPALSSEVSQANANEAAGEAAPDWSEDWNIEFVGNIEILSIFFELHWQQKRTGGTTSSAKWQITDDGGTTWVDVTDNVAETSTSYVDHARVGIGQHITGIERGVSQLGLRLCAWSADATSVETKIRSDSYIRVTYKKY